jgi:hypothetical protein
MDPELSALAVYIGGKSRSDIGRLRQAKIAEVGALQRAIASGRKPFDGDNFAVKRDTRRIAELRKEIDFLASVFDPASTQPPPEAA